MTVNVTNRIISLISKIEDMRITKVYTKTGDKGTTSLVGGIRVSKASERIEAYGTVDELSSQLGLLAAQIGDGELRDDVERIQNTLFNVCSYLATDTTQTPVYASAKLDTAETAWLETSVDAIMAELPEKLGFVLPGGTIAAAQAHVCRAVCRRAERRIVALAEKADINADVLRYVNRLSDYLFVLAKKLNFIAGRKEKIWCNSCK